MSALSDRIAEVLAEHRYIQFTGVCPCGFRFDTRDTHDAHVAERVCRDCYGKLAADELTAETERLGGLSEETKAAIRDKLTGA